jgi:pilus assembly protein CpaC
MNARSTFQPFKKSVTRVESIMKANVKFPKLKTFAFALGTASALAAMAQLPVVQTANAAEGVVKLKSSKTTQRVKLGFNKSIVIDLPTDAYDILVANPAVADAVTRTSRRIYLFGKQVGETNIFVFGADGQQILSLDLAIERDVAGLEAHLEKYIKGSDIKVELINDNVVLTGMVQTPLDSSRAAQLAEIFVTGGEATTGNYATTAGGGASGGDVDINNPDQQRRTSKIVNLLNIIGEDQVTLKVTIAEVQRTVVKQLGMNMVSQSSAQGLSYSNFLDNVPGLGNRIANNVSALTATFGSTSISSYINAMEKAGVLRTLAEPNLTAISGEQATFQVGGQFPMIRRATTDDEGRISYELEFIDYGIGLEFLPVVLSAGRISLKVRTSVSEPTTENAFTNPGGRLENGTIVPGVTILSLRKRLADTTVELPSGGTMMIAGLVQDDIRQVASGVPGLSKVPVLGTLFRSRDFQRNETELVILITPYISRPTARNDMARPDDNFTPASDGAQMFLNKVNRVYGSAQTKLPNGRYHGVVGFIYK